MNNCPKCNSSEIKTERSAISGKEVCLCKNCEHIWQHERIHILIDKDGIPLIELETENPFESIFNSTFPFKANGVFPFYFEAYFVEEDDDKNEDNSDE